ncbi:Neurexin-3-beta, partial [Cichlidogyrus casuarinus]
GPDHSHSDFICVELFDGNVYFVYGVSGHSRHIQLNPEGRKVNDGATHSVYFERSPEHRFKVRYNGQDVDIKQPETGHQAAFNTYTYFGSVDQPSRLPWEVWSRVNFAGCIEHIKVNNQGYLDFT